MQVLNQKFFRALGEGCKTRARGATGKHFGIFVLNNLKTTFWMTNLNSTQSRPFFSKSGHFFDFKKSRGGPPLIPPVAHLWVLWMWLNMYQYPWASLNTLKMLEQTVLIILGLWICMIILHIWQAFEDDSKTQEVLNKPGFWIWHNWIWKSYAESWMSDYGSIPLNNAWICLSMP